MVLPATLLTVGYFLSHLSLRGLGENTNAKTAFEAKHYFVHLMP